MRLYFLLLAGVLIWFSKGVLPELNRLALLSESGFRHHQAALLPKEVLHHSIQKWEIPEFALASKEAPRRIQEQVGDRISGLSSSIFTTSTLPDLEEVREVYREVSGMKPFSGDFSWVRMEQDDALDQSFKAYNFYDFLQRKDGFLRVDSVLIAMKAYILMAKIALCVEALDFDEYAPEVRWLSANLPIGLLLKWTGKPVHALSYQRPWSQEVMTQAQKNGVSPSLIYAMMKAESRFDPGIVSRAGAVGLMQIMPNTARGLLGRRVAVEELKDPKMSIELGARYLAVLMKRFSKSQTDVWAAAYNAGPTHAGRWMNEQYAIDLEKLDFVETSQYLQRVLVGQAFYQSLKNLEP